MNIPANFTCTFPLPVGRRGRKARQVCRVPAIQKYLHTEVSPPSSPSPVCLAGNRDQSGCGAASRCSYTEVCTGRCFQYSRTGITRLAHRVPATWGKERLNPTFFPPPSHLGAWAVAPSSLLVYQEGGVVADRPVDRRLHVHWAGQSSSERNQQHSETEHRELRDGQRENFLPTAAI